MKPYSHWDEYMGQMYTFDQSEGIHHYMVDIDGIMHQGSRGPAQSDEILRRAGIVGVLSVTAVSLQPIREAFRWTMAIDDNLAWSERQVQFVLNFCKFIKTAGSKGLVHCDHGASRSSGAAILWIMFSTGVDKEEASRRLTGVNPRARVHPAIFASLPMNL